VAPEVAPAHAAVIAMTPRAASSERTVDGKVALDYAPFGLTWRLTCSAANALQCRQGEAMPQQDNKGANPQPWRRIGDVVPVQTYTNRHNWPLTSVLDGTYMSRVKR
jgi:hypothetical protein